MWYWNGNPMCVFTPGEDDLSWMLEHGYDLVLGE